MHMHWYISFGDMLPPLFIYYEMSKEERKERQRRGRRDKGEGGEERGGEGGEK